MSSIVYFIEAVDDNKVKIGTTSYNVDDRLRALQTGSAYLLKLILTIPGDSVIEKELHERFKGLMRMNTLNILALYRVSGMNLLTLTQFTERYMRRLLAERDENGLADAVFTLSQKMVLIDEEKFLAWMESKRGKQTDE